MICPICESDVSPNETVCRGCGAPVVPEKKDKTSYALPVGASLKDGQFTIGRLLGKGGFGVTYLGSDVHLRRSVAIKELFPSGCQRDNESLVPGPSWPAQKLAIAKDKFLNEARVLAQFHHPNIVHVYTSFEQNNTAYMVMEYVKGRTIQQLIREFTTIPEPEAVDYTTQLADALRHLHDSNILHRDIKPGNVLVADDGRVTLIDFGTAREFAVDSAKQMTTMLTPGYAPLEQYTRSGKVGPYSDIYSLGATVYHMLTGQQPIAATDQANGAILVPPRQLNGDVSVVVSDAVMWAMQSDSTQRPQTIDEFLGALEGQIEGPKGRRRATHALDATGSDDNPYKQRIEQILDELSAGTPAAPRGAHDQRIDQIATQLSAITSIAVPAFPVCPGCAQPTVKELRGDTPTKNCPICRKTEMVIRDTSLTHCPICREGRLTRHQLDPASVFCPICRSAPMKSEQRKRFGFAMMEVHVCQHCQTELKVVLGGKLRLDKIGADRFGAGRKHHDDALTLPEWQQISGRAQEYLECEDCHAQLDVIPDKHALAIGWYSEDPHGVAAKAARQALPRLVWANLAAGLSPRTPNATCPGCRSEFEMTPETQEIKAVKVNAQEYPWSQRILNKPVPFRNWFLVDAGKRSPTPGYLCSNCRTEFDQNEKLLKLVFAGSAALAGREGESHSREGWHRIALGMPTRSEEAALRDELTKLHIKKQEEQEHYFKEEARYQGELREELDQLIHAAFVAGHVPILLKDTSIFLLEGEIVYWESPAKRNQRTSVSGDRTWTFETSGVLFLTNQRMIFASKVDTWQHSLDEIEKIVIEDSYQSRIVAVYRKGYSVPVGFDIGASEFTVTTEYSNHTVRGGARDFAVLALAIRARQLGEEPPDASKLITEPVKKSTHNSEK
ncbi:MAG: serine/threonine-protein kinase [Capsulimonadaceae bacterium]|nr:serine/threonine-protein kinase [Capsulimonadaceae bacterium]